MKKKSNSQSAFFNFRVLIVVVLCLLGVVLTLFGSGMMSGPTARAKGANQKAAASHKLSVRDRHLAESLKRPWRACRRRLRQLCVAGGKRCACQ